MKKFTVRVPATTANMGSGFDALGMALTLYNTFTFSGKKEGFEITGVETKLCNEDNLVYQSYLKTFEKIGKKAPAIKIHIEDEIPISRGLGSSATCIIAGVMAALYISEKKIDKEKVFAIASEIEGHPDNVAPAVFGGLVASLVHEGKFIYQDVPIKKELKMVALIPNFRLSTQKARDVLPKRVSFKDACFNLSRLALFMASVTSGNFDHLDIACEDALHQMVRSPLIPDYDKVMDYAKESGALAGFLSGAGSSLMFIVKKPSDFVKKMEEKTDYVWTAKALKIDKIGAMLI